MKFILATDVGSTTTKARLFNKLKGEWRFIVAGEAPTTVEAPYEDVTQGVKNAIREIEELIGHRILSKEGTAIIAPCEGNVGVDLYCTTSSAGGGLQMMVAGLVKSMSADSANRAALGAGAIVMDVIALDDGREPFEKIKRIRNLRPDMILLAGGTDGGADSLVVGISELIKAAEPKPRLGISYKLPLVYAGNKILHTQIRNMMDDDFELVIVDNLRPVLELENTDPSRRAIHEVFMEHVMSHAPGYTKLMKWTEVEIMPTPLGEGIAIQLIAKTYRKNVLGVGLGGATTNVYSILDDRFVRSVSANLGMSYSITNVMKEAKIGNIMRWLPFNLSENDIRRRLMNKMIRPTTIPQTLEELIIEHAVAREALRLGLEHHKTIATRLKGVQTERSLGELMDQALRETYVNMMDIEIIAGTGGLLSHAPLRAQSMLVMIDGFQPEGNTWLFQDSVFMMPHLGVLSTVYPEVAWQIFDKDCLVHLGTVIAPKGTTDEEGEVMSIKMEMPDGSTREERVNFGEMLKITLPERANSKVIIEPNKDFDMGSGPGKTYEGTVMGGEVGVIIDGRGRPLRLPEDEEKRMEALINWFDILGLYGELQNDRN